MPGIELFDILVTELMPHPVYTSLPMGPNYFWVVNFNKC